MTVGASGKPDGTAVLAALQQARAQERPALLRRHLGLDPELGGAAVPVDAEALQRRVADLLRALGGADALAQLGSRAELTELLVAAGVPKGDASAHLAALDEVVAAHGVVADLGLGPKAKRPGAELRAVPHAEALADPQRSVATQVTLLPESPEILAFPGRHCRVDRVHVEVRKAGEVHDVGTFSVGLGINQDVLDLIPIFDAEGATWVVLAEIMRPVLPARTDLAKEGLGALSDDEVRVPPTGPHWSMPSRILRPDEDGTLEAAGARGLALNGLAPRGDAPELQLIGAPAGSSMGGVTEHAQAAIVEVAASAPFDRDLLGGDGASRRVKALRLDRDLVLGCLRGSLVVDGETLVFRDMRLTLNLLRAARHRGIDLGLRLEDLGLDPGRPIDLRASLVPPTSFDEIAAAVAQAGHGESRLEVTNLGVDPEQKFLAKVVGEARHVNAEGEPVGQPHPFEFVHRRSKPEAANSVDVMAFCCDLDGRWWIGTKIGGRPLQTDEARRSGSTMFPGKSPGLVLECIAGTGDKPADATAVVDGVTVKVTSPSWTKAVTVGEVHGELGVALQQGAEPQKLAFHFVSPGLTSEGVTFVAVAIDPTVRGPVEHDVTPDETFTNQLISPEDLVRLGDAGLCIDPRLLLMGELLVACGVGSGRPVER